MAVPSIEKELVEPLLTEAGVESLQPPGFLLSNQIYALGAENLKFGHLFSAQWRVVVLCTVQASQVKTLTLDLLN